MLKSNSNTIYFVFIVWVSAILFSQTVNGDEHSSLIQIYATENNSPFSFSLPDGTPTGFYVEYWKLWSQSSGIPIQINMTSFENTIQMAKQRNYVHAGLFSNASRSQWADFSLPIHRVATGVLYKSNLPSSTRLEELYNSKVAVHRKSFQAKYLQENYPDLELFYYSDSEVNSDNDDIVLMLLYDEIQAVVAEMPFLKSQLAKNGLNGVFNFSDKTLLSNQVHAVIAKDQPQLLKLLNDGIRNISLKKLIQLENKWLPNIEPFYSEKINLELFTSKEKKWLKNHPQLTVGIDQSWYPIEFVDNKGTFSGISADYLSIISEQLDINFQPLLNKSWREAFNGFKQGKVDLMLSIVATDTRKNNYLFSQPYFSTPTVIATKRGSFYAENLLSLKNRKLALVRGFSIVEVVKNDYPDIDIILVDSVKHGLTSLLENKVDAFLGANAVINYEIDKLKTNDLIIAGFSPYLLEISIAVNNELEPLVPILNKVFDNISDKEKAAISNSWFAIQISNGIDLKTILIFALPILSFFIIIITIVIRFNRALKIEITNRKNVEAELKHLAQHDPLTQLANKRLFEQLSSVALNLARRSKKQQALMFIDIDGFKPVNDSFGHVAGDKLLIDIAARLNQSVRHSDIVARVGGDEFVIHLANECDRKDAQIIASKILAALEVSFELEQGIAKISASIGIAIFPTDGDNVNELLHSADKAMYKAKRAGKNTFKFFSQR